MKMRQSLVWAFAVALLAGAAVPSISVAAPGDDKPARARAGAGRGAIEMLNRAAQSDAVKLDDEQKSKVREVIEDAKAQAKAKQDEAKAAGDQADRKANREAMAELMTQTKDRLEAILTEPQKAAFRTALTEEREKAKAAREENQGDKEAKGGKKKAA